ncbi:MAG: hypothetical protein AB1422_01255 [bacterium]
MKLVFLHNHPDLTPESVRACPDENQGAGFHTNPGLAPGQASLTITFCPIIQGIYNLHFFLISLSPFLHF